MNSQTWLYQLRIGEKFSFNGVNYRYTPNRFEVGTGITNVENLDTGDFEFLLRDTKVVPVNQEYTKRITYENCRPLTQRGINGR